MVPVVGPAIQKLLQLIKAPLKSFWNLTIRVLAFNLLFVTYLSAKAIAKLGQHRFCPPVLKQLFQPWLEKIYNQVVHWARRDNETINRLNLIELAIKNMRAKPSRTIVTAGGMAVGIGTIVFLVSLGYGVERLVINRVARLDELKQTDVSIQAGNPARLNDQTLSQFEQVPEVEYTLPLIGVVGRINYQNSVSDVAVYGVTAEYLRQSAIKPVRGTVFESNTIAQVVEKNAKNPVVAGATTSKPETKPGYKSEIRPVSVEMDTGVWLRVRSAPDANSKLIGHTRRVSAEQAATEVWGYAYAGQPEATAKDRGRSLGKWITGQFQLWDKTDCDPNQTGCEPGGYELQSTENQTGYIAQLGMTVSEATNTSLATAQTGQVLGESISLQELLNEDGSVKEGVDEELLKLASESGLIDQESITTIPLADSAEKTAVVNQALLRVLGITENQAINQTFQIQFVVTSDLLSSQAEKVESVAETYSIIGIIPGDESPFLYVPFLDLRGLGIDNYSQVKLVVGNQNQLSRVRQQVESMGFVTNSVVDTVAQIDRLFDTVRVILAGMGIVALSVASLGMFNTLTVSLLERTREVGLMKAMGMKSHEVQDLFLTESMTMGFVGGFVGIGIGFVGGKLLGFLLSVIAVSQGAGLIDVSYIPPLFMTVVFLLSVFVGVFTGLYPAYRATKISALDALRYE